MVNAPLKTIFEQPDEASTWAQHARVVEQLQAAKLADAADLVTDAAPDLLAFATFAVAKARPRVIDTTAQPDHDTHALPEAS